MDQEVVIVDSSPEWVALQHNPQFQRFLLWLDQTAQAHQESWASREYESDEPHLWLRHNAAALGRVDLCKEIIHMFENLPAQQKETKDG